MTTLLQVSPALVAMSPAKAVAVIQPVRIQLTGTFTNIRSATVLRQKQPLCRGRTGVIEFDRATRRGRLVRRLVWLSLGRVSENRITLSFSEDIWLRHDRVAQSDAGLVVSALEPEACKFKSAREKQPGGPSSCNDTIPA